MFQFYDSPIKSFLAENASKSAETRFQFYDSPIKSFMNITTCTAWIVSIL